MEGELHQYELRSRSRSRSQTPMVLNRSLEPEQVDHHYDLRSKSRERSHTPADLNTSRRSGSRSLPGSASKSRDHSMQAIIESKEEAFSETALETHSRKSDSSATTITKKPERRSERQKAKKQVLANGQEDFKSNTLETRVEQKRKSLTPQRLLTSDYSSEEGEREDPPSRPGSAYEIYKQAGEWWNVFPKTDYTYSQKSQCRYEIAPGVLAMPNMSRRSIHSEDNNVINSVPSINQHNTSQSLHVTAESGIGDSLDSGGDHRERDSQRRSPMESFLDFRSQSRNSESGTRSMYKKTYIEQYSSHKEVINADPTTAAEFKQRYFSWTGNATSRYSDPKFGRTTQVDSDTELDEAVKTPVFSHQWRITQWFQSVITLITYTFSRSLEFLRFKTSRSREYRSPYNYRYQDSKWSKLWRSIGHSSQYIYLLLLKVIFCDTWLLSRIYNLRRHVAMKGPKILWITLLPLLLLAGAYITQKHSFTCPDSLRNVRNGVTETTYHIFNDITNLTSFEYELLAKYLMNFKDYVLHLPPSVNVSLPEMPSIGYTFLPYILPYLPTFIHTSNKSEVIVPLNAKTNVFATEYKDNSFTENSNLMHLFEKLSERIARLESGNTYHSENLLNITQSLEGQKHTTAGLWKQYNDKIIELEKKLDEEKSQNDVHSDMNTIRQEFHILRELYTQLKTCCHTESKHLTSDNVQEHIEKTLATYLGVSQADLPRAIKSLDSRREQTSSVGLSASPGVTDEQVRGIVSGMLKTYDADKTGRVDYALEPAGGQIISTRCTQRYDQKSRAFHLLGFTWYHDTNNPRTVIQGNPLQPGICWAFQSFPGYLLIKLRSFIYVTGFTMEHVHKSIIPNGEIKSAPRKFNVWGYVAEADLNPIMLGDYEFVNSDENLQYFPVQNTDVNIPFEYVELRVHSNHGQWEYTCLYRFRVHGRSV